MLDKAIKYFDKEYEKMEQRFNNPLRPLSTKSKRIAVSNTIARCLGVAMFVQECGVTYNEIVTPFEEVKTKLMKLIEREE